MIQGHEEMIAVIRAHAEGKEIEYRYADIGMSQKPWLSMESPQFFNFSECFYRVKPEPPKPREWWILPSNESRIPLDEILDGPPNRIYLHCYIHVREVID